ncbi:tRNA threonylcarbamoyladenosine biosynthesis protein TsaB [Belliella buryatensis]|uniref:tRNA threonylcarbamoyladenosine biosynthesis protein TsaB n=1 Tax=Belliella buryatensis TaxID=1500549 RepID=A0A239GSD3_9BACT|nr:tRNA (adenosine(37)-N6)-threonylcarbamoyltransferase complex dimerization subunit type 1 TsaB [Belliella buryatensis]SNS72050.1 tRNA threonylcarbamoyladenosine biosynthesis protein TsaB [Belliella buryatensis]
MAIILSIETATQVCSVSVHNQGQLMGLTELHVDNMHAQKLMKLIDDLLKNLSLKVRSLSAIAVSQGPGSYTGLRIGVSTAKGLAFSHDLPLIAVNTLQALATQVLPFALASEYIIPMIDARRMEVYACVVSGLGEVLGQVAPVILEENSFVNYLDRERVYFLGDGSEKFSTFCKHPNACFLPHLNSSCTIGNLAFDKFQKREFEDLAYFEPNYLKEFMVLKSKKNPFLV